MRFAWILGSFHRSDVAHPPRSRANRHSYRAGAAMDAPQRSLAGRHTSWIGLRSPVRQPPRKAILRTLRTRPHTPAFAPAVWTATASHRPPPRPHSTDSCLPHNDDLSTTDRFALCRAWVRFIYSCPPPTPTAFLIQKRTDRSFPADDPRSFAATLRFSVRQQWLTPALRVSCCGGEGSGLRQRGSPGSYCGSCNFTRIAVHGYYTTAFTYHLPTLTQADAFSPPAAYPHPAHGATCYADNRFVTAAGFIANRPHLLLLATRPSLLLTPPGTFRTNQLFSKRLRFFPSQ